MQTALEYDAFISYRWSEPSMSWVRKRLVPGLEERGVSVCLDAREFVLGAPLVTEMERAVIASGVTISVMTPAYLESGFTDLEKLMAQHLSAEQRLRRWIAVIREPLELGLIDGFRLALDMSDDGDFDANVTRLASAVISDPQT